MALPFPFALHERDFDRNPSIGYSLFMAPTNPMKHEIKGLTAERDLPAKGEESLPNIIAEHRTS
jgi:hypothetical protein